MQNNEHFCIKQMLSNSQFVLIGKSSEVFLMGSLSSRVYMHSHAYACYSCRLWTNSTYLTRSSCSENFKYITWVIVRSHLPSNDAYLQDISDIFKLIGKLIISEILIQLFLY